MGDLEWSATEGEGETPSLSGYLGALRYSLLLGGWAVTHSLHTVYTDPFLYDFLQPLNTYASRRVLTSNMQVEANAAFVDKYMDGSGPLLHLPERGRSNNQVHDWQILRYLVYNRGNDNNLRPQPWGHPSVFSRSFNG